MIETHQSPKQKWRSQGAGISEDLAQFMLESGRDLIGRRFKLSSNSHDESTVTFRDGYADIFVDRTYETYRLRVTTEGVTQRRRLQRDRPLADLFETFAGNEDSQRFHSGQDSMPAKLKYLPHAVKSDPLGRLGYRVF